MCLVKILSIVLWIEFWIGSWRFGFEFSVLFFILYYIFGGILLIGMFRNFRGLGMFSVGFKDVESFFRNEF